METSRIGDLEVVFSDRQTMDTNIEFAVDCMIEQAMEDRGCGVLISRLENGRAVVSLSRSVPFGYTEHRDLRVDRI